MWATGAGCGRPTPAASASPPAARCPTGPPAAAATCTCSTSRPSPRRRWFGVHRAGLGVPAQRRQRGLAFARVYERRSGLRGDVPYLYVKKIEAQRSSQRLPGASRGRTGLPGPTALDLDDPGGNLSTIDGNRLGFAWEWATDAGAVQSEVRIDRVAPRRIDLVEASTDRALITPQFDRGTQFGFRGALYYAAVCRPEPAGDGECEGPSEIRKYATDAGRLETAPRPDNLTALTVSFRFFRGAGAARRARDPQRSCATDDGSRRCAVLELDRPEGFRTIPPRSG